MSYISTPPEGRAPGQAAGGESLPRRPCLSVFSGRSNRFLLFSSEPLGSVDDHSARLRALAKHRDGACLRVHLGAIARRKLRHRVGLKRVHNGDLREHAALDENRVGRGHDQRLGHEVCHG